MEGDRQKGMGEGEIRQLLRQKEKDGLRPEGKAWGGEEGGRRRRVGGGRRAEMWERQLNKLSSCSLPSPVLGALCTPITFNIHNPGSVIVPTLQMEREVIQTLFDALSHEDFRGHLKFLL